MAIDLGTLGGSRSQATAVNNKGHVVGWSYLTGDTARHAFLWTPEQGMIDLGTLGGSRSEATNLNDQDQVIGVSWTGGLESHMHAFSWTQSGGMVDVGTLGHWWSPSVYTQGNASEAVAINENGQVVGWSYIRDDSSYMHAFSWTQSRGIIDLGVLGEDGYVARILSRAKDVSDNGQVVGDSYTGFDTAHRAFSWTASGGMVDLGTLGGSESISVAVNNGGVVVGWSQTGGSSPQWHAFSWTAAGGMVDLGTLGGSRSSVTALNDLGQVVGWSEVIVGNTATHAFSWTDAGGMVDIGETAPGSRTTARAVSETGVVFGEGYITVSGPSHDAFVWSLATGLVVLGPLGGGSSVTDVSANGYFVGSQPAGDSAEHAMLWQVQTPVISSATATPDVLWPPNRQMIPVSLAVSASDASGLAPACEISAVSSNEPPTIGGEPDWIVTGPLTVSLRAARGGNGNDRLYTATVTCTNVAGLSDTKEVTVRVPHDASR